MAFQYDPNMPWFWLDGELHPFEKSEEGYAIPNWAKAASGDEGSSFRIADSDGPDAAQIRAKTIGLLGFDPDDKIVNPDQTVSIRNPATGAYEQAVAAGDIGTYMPISMAQQQGLPIHQYATEIPETSTWGQIAELITPPAQLAAIAAAANGFGNWLGPMTEAAVAAPSAGLANGSASLAEVGATGGVTGLSTSAGAGTGLSAVPNAAGVGSLAQPIATSTGGLGLTAGGITAGAASGFGWKDLVQGAKNFAEGTKAVSGATQLAGAAGLGSGAISQGGPVAGTSTTSTTTSYSPEEAVRRQQVMDAAMQMWKGGTPQYPGAAPVPFSADTVAAQDRLRSFSAGAGANVANTAGNALEFGLNSVLNPTSTPGFQASLDTATRKIGQAYTDPGGVISNIRSSFGTANSAGTGSREGIAGGIAARSYLDAIGDVTGKMTSDAYSKGLDTFSKTLAFAPNAYSLMTQPALTQAAVGQQIDEKNQATAQYEADAKLWGVNYPMTSLQNYANIIYGGSTPTTSSTASVPEAKQNPLMPVGAGLMGAQLSQMLGVSPLVGGAAGLLYGLLS